MISATMTGANQYAVTVAEKTAVDGAENDHEFKVELDPEFYQALCAGGVTHEWVLVQSFHFLLEREDVGQILPQFNLRQISDYFPEFVTEMRLRLVERTR